MVVTFTGKECAAKFGALFFLFHFAYRQDIGVLGRKILEI